MMSFQNPSFPQNSSPYGAGPAPGGNFNAAGMNQALSMQQFPADFPQQAQFQNLGGFQNNNQRAPQVQQQPHGQVPPHVYQQIQQQTQQQQGGFVRPQSRGPAGLAQAQPNRPSPGNQIPPGNARNSNTPQSTTPASSQPAMMQQQQQQQMPTVVAQTNAMSGAGTPARANVNQPSQPQTPMSPQAIAREEDRVTTLLHINSLLLQEAANLHAQGKAGSGGGQQSPTSPTTNDPSGAGSPGGADAAKKVPPSQEYADCMRRLQTNLQYLAAQADANKKANGARPPPGPAIMVPPSHMQGPLNGLYSKLKTLFPEASQSTLNKAIAQAAKNSPAPTINVG